MAGKWNPPEPLTASHRTAGFDCGKPILNEWLKKHGLQASHSGSTRTFVVSDEGLVIAYYSLTAASLDFSAAPERLRKGLPRYPIPAVLLARLAIDRSVQGKGLGRSLLQDVFLRILNVASDVGVRALLVDAIDEKAARFYEKWGFEPFLDQPDRLFMLMKEIRRTLE